MPRSVSKKIARSIPVMGGGKAKGAKFGRIDLVGTQFVAVVLSDETTCADLPDKTVELIPPEGKEIGKFKTEKDARNAIHVERKRIQRNKRARVFRANDPGDDSEHALRVKVDCKMFADVLKEAGYDGDLEDTFVQQGHAKRIFNLICLGEIKIKTRYFPSGPGAGNDHANAQKGPENVQPAEKHGE